MILEFGLDTIVALLAIVSALYGAFYRFILRPVIKNFEMARRLDTYTQKMQYESLISTIQELKEEIKQSRLQRAGFDAELSSLKARIVNLEDDVRELRTYMHGLQEGVR